MAVLDASFLIDLEQQHPKASELLRSLVAKGEPMLVPAQAAAEIVAGTNAPLQVWAWLESAFTVVFPRASHVLESARLYMHAKDHGGRRVPWSDAQIAAVATLEADQVITANPRDFEAMGAPCLDHRNADDDSSAAA